MQGRIEYKLDIQPHKYLTLPSFNYSPLKYPSAGLTIDVSSASDREIVLKMEFNSVASVGEAQAIGMDLASAFADRIAYDYGIRLNSPIETHRHFSDTLNFQGSAASLISFGSTSDVVDPSEIPALTATFSVDEPNRGAWKSIVRFVTTCDDPVGRYLLLYAVLYELQGRSQRQIDGWLNQSHGVPVPHINGRTGHPMTDYTKLRNDIAHPVGVSLEATRAEMASKLGKLLEFVKSAIALTPA